MSDTSCCVLYMFFSVRLVTLISMTIYYLAVLRMNALFIYCWFVRAYRKLFILGIGERIAHRLFVETIL